MALGEDQEMTTLFHRTGVRRNWRRAYLIELAFGIIVLAGCRTEQPAPVVDIAPLSSQIGSLAQANSDLRAANERLQSANDSLAAENEHLKSQLRADADAGLAANSKGWLPFEGYVWQQQIARLPGVEPDAATASKWTEAAGLYAAGGESAMQGVINSLHSDATTQAEKLGELTTRIKQLTKERDAAQEAATRAQKAVHDAEDALAAAVEQARQDEARKIRDAQSAWANRWGGYAAIGAILALIGIYWLGEGAVVACIGLGTSSLLLFGYARLLNWPYYDWVVGGVVAIGLVAGIVYLKRISQQKKTAKTVTPFAITLVDILNEADKTARGTEMEAVLDKLIFDKIKDADVTGQFDVIRHELETQKAMDAAKK